VGIDDDVLEAYATILEDHYACLTRIPGVRAESARDAAFRAAVLPNTEETPSTDLSVLMRTGARDYARSRVLAVGIYAARVALDALGTAIDNAIVASRTALYALWNADECTVDDDGALGDAQDAFNVILAASDDAHLATLGMDCVLDDLSNDALSAVFAGYNAALAALAAALDGACQVQVGFSRDKYVSAGAVYDAAVLGPPSASAAARDAMSAAWAEIAARDAAHLTARDAARVEIAARDAALPIGGDAPHPTIQELPDGSIAQGVHAVAHAHARVAAFLGSVRASYRAAYKSKTDT
jgi:hypothetical protein